MPRWIAAALNHYITARHVDTQSDTAPFASPDKNAEDGMVRVLAPGVIGKCAVTGRCAVKMERPEYGRK